MPTTSAERKTRMQSKNIVDVFFAGLLLLTVPGISVLNTFLSQYNVDASNLPGWAVFLEASIPTFTPIMATFLFFFFACLFYWIPGKFVLGPVTPHGHIPVYVENGIAHLLLSTSVFFIGGWYCELFQISIFFDNIHRITSFLNVCSIVFCIFLYWKAIHHPSTPDVTRSGNGCIYDYYAGLELYPNIFGYDVKKLVNCRFSMTFWMLFGASCVHASFKLHGEVDYCLLANSVSTFLYLVTFFIWETGYMQSIDIIEDNAGFMETWGCLVFVPAVYTTHLHAAVNTLSRVPAVQTGALFALNLTCIFLTLWTNKQREVFRKTKGKSMLWWPTPPRSIAVKYHLDVMHSPFETRTLGEQQQKVMTSILLCNGFWGVVRHPQYVFELGIAVTWGLLGNPQENGPRVMIYPVFLSILLVHRAFRDRNKCRRKYGDGYLQYEMLVPYMIIPGII